ncbi:hypothetical protein [Burkholderia ubonensis]|uniref:hypothetical protein n=1 Tax=Burkholderia ubonensis TaxID=101571 RepID=UPI000AFC37CC|nr:hypothetical protein [Burkholderia ubonensis]
MRRAALSAARRLVAFIAPVMRAIEATFAMRLRFTDPSPQKAGNDSSAQARKPSVHRTSPHTRVQRRLYSYKSDQSEGVFKNRIENDLRLR